jgi:flagellar hook-associated protein 3 FlgL
MSTINSLYPFAGGLVSSHSNTRQLINMRSQLDELQRQLASGARSSTYGGLGNARVSSLTFRSQTGVMDGYKNVSDLTAIRMSVMDQSTNELRSTVESARKVMISGRGTSSWSDITAAKQQVQAQFEQMISTLNGQHEGLYIYSGRSRDVKPVVDGNTLINGDGTNAGLRQVVDERRQADIGTGNGRMVSTLVGATASLSEDVAGSPFGIKLIAGSVGGAMTNMTVTGPGGAPSSISFAFSGQPLTGERVSVGVTLPDGTTTTLGFAVDTAGTSDDTVFALGATPAATAANLKAAIDGRLSSMAQGELREASAVVAANQFFSGSNTTPVPRVQPPFATSTTYAAPGTIPTVTWYKGDDDATVAARDTQKAEIDSGTSVSFGARANEAAFRDSLMGMSLILVEDYPPNVSTTQARFEAAAGRALTVFNGTGGPNAILDVNAQFGRAAAQVADAKTRMSDRKSFLSGLLAEIEGVSTEEVAMKINALNTTLQASYTTTAKLSQLSLVNYL